MGLDPAILDRYRTVATKLVSLPHYTLRDTEGILSYMRQDKKNAGGEIRCVLLQELGAPVIDLAVEGDQDQCILHRFSFRFTGIAFERRCIVLQTRGPAK